MNEDDLPSLVLEPVGSCDECGCDLYDDEIYSGVCDQCAWWAEQAGDTEDVQS